MTNEIRECTNCEAVITEGFYAEWADTCYCSEACAVQDLGEQDVQEGKEDETFFWTVWTEWDSITNTTSYPEIHKGYRMHDNLYFTRSTAELFNDGKDQIDETYFVVLPDETWYEGGQLDNYYTQPTYKLAEELAEELMED